MSTLELKQDIHRLVDAIQDNNLLNSFYKYLVSAFKQKQKKEDAILTHFSSQSSLAKDWNTPLEDEAWKNL
jgi:hypothetical protein